MQTLIPRDRVLPLSITGSEGLPQYPTAASDGYPFGDGSVSPGARLNALRQPGAQNGRNGRRGSGNGKGIDLAGIASFGGLVDSSGISKEILDAVAQQVGLGWRAYRDTADHLHLDRKTLRSLPVTWNGVWAVLAQPRVGSPRCGSWFDTGRLACT